MIEYLGVIYLGLLTLNAWALLSVVQSGAGLTSKAVWALLLCLPGLGFVAWYLLGPRAAT